jgi:DNA-directed RNA polymerase subunit K/omega
MSVRIESRSGEIDTERCVEHAGGRYDLVIAASQRLREMKRRARETNTFVTPIDALKEVQAGMVNMADYMAKVK